MNPFTKQLLAEIDDEQLIAWVSIWDRFEELVISIYRANRATKAQHPEYMQLKERLLKDYGMWSQGLEPHWRGRQAAGKPVKSDPFRLLLSAQRAEEFVDDWRAMQLLPAAREALNRFLLARAADPGASESG